MRDSRGKGAGMRDQDHPPPLPDPPPTLSGQHLTQPQLVCHNLYNIYRSSEVVGPGLLYSKYIQENLSEQSQGFKIF